MVFDELKAKAGFGGVKVEILLPKNTFRRDESLEGEVQILGGKVSQKIQALNVRLIREWSWESYSTGMDMDFEPGIARGPYSTDRISVQTQYELDGDRGKDKIANIELGKDIELQPKEKKIFPFKLDLSEIREEKGVQEVWKLKAQADIPFAKDSIVEREINIVFSRKADK